MSIYEDHWFIQNINKNGKIHATGTIHVISKEEAANSLQYFIDFRDYLSTNKSAFDRYYAVKKMNLDGDFMNYKIAKMYVCDEINKEIFELKKENKKNKIKDIKNI